MTKKILITGGAGFIGSHLSMELLNKGYEVSVYDNLSPQIHGDGKSSPLFRAIQDHVNFIHADVRNYSEIKKAILNNSIIVHLAAETGTGQSMYQISQYVDVNVGGTANILQCLANEKHPVKKVIVASSRAIYGEGKYICPSDGEVFPNPRRDWDMQNKKFECSCPVCGGEVLLCPTDEAAKIHPTSVYGITKQNQEQMILTVCESLGIPAVSFRYQNVFGPGQSLSNPYTGILSIFSTQIKNGNDINIFEDGQESRDFVYIDDVVSATVLGIENNNVKNNFFNVGSGKAITVESVAKVLLAKYAGDNKCKVSGNYRLGDIRHNYADLKKIHEALGFVPKYSFQDGIEKFLSWVEDQTICEDKYEKSFQEMKLRGLLK